ncbi:hypothetical protein CASFOL_026114 [Castilleja foliolosa]|uniref:PPM-type phosphatase domain-containing protein n=1 Tax=Castilleja foliolosa TaxID=1961234 RepID=A0ABD3CWV4_9LAMI
MGVYLSTPSTEKASEDGENDRLRYGLSSMQGWRATMEDACKEVSKFCAKFLHRQVMEHEAYVAGDLNTSLKKAFLRIMDQMMCGKTGQKELALLRGKDGQPSEDTGQTDRWPEEVQEILSGYHGPSAGTTACVAIIRNNQLLVANAGDSRCVMSRKGQAYDLSKDHKPDIAAEKRRILEAGGYVQYGRVNGSLNLARAIGDMEMKQNKSLPAEKQIVTADPDIVTIDRSDDDEFLIIACDGIWDCMSSQQAVDFVKEQLKTEKKLSMVCERTFDRCLAPSSGQEGCDNMTMILVQFKKPFSKEEPESSVQ